MSKKSLLKTIMVLFLIGKGFAAHSSDKFIVLGTAYESGTYYPVGRALCSRVNEFHDITNIRCHSYATGGSLYNIEALASGELDMGITQANLAYDAFLGVKQFSGRRPLKELRKILDLYDQPLTVSVRKGSKIKSFKDFQGKIINIGNVGSGKRTLGDKMLRLMGVERSYFRAVTEYSTAMQIEQFCRGTIDIMIESVGIPTPLYKKVESCGGIFLDLPQEIIAGFEKISPFFYAYRIPKGINNNNARSVKTIGMRVTLISRSSISNDTIASMVQNLIGQPGIFKKLHPALSLSPVDRMQNEENKLPLHDGVKRFFAGKNERAK